MLSRPLLRLPAVLAITVLLALLSPAASAAPASPRGLTPSGPVSSSSLTLAWDRVAGATSYRVQLSDSPEFTTLPYNVTTTNNKATPTVQLPFGEVWWRVQAVGASGTGEWSTTSFERAELAGPVLNRPYDDETLDQPEEPALLSWYPVNGATSYTIEIDQDTDFIGATKYTTKNTAYVVPNPQVATDYYWRVRATLAKGIETLPSEPRTYEIGGLEPPALDSPADSPDTEIEDVVLDWFPVEGAASYDLQVSTDENFPAETTEEIKSIRGTRWSPARTLENDQYFWRVRPLDAQGNKLDWAQTETWEFKRHWPDQPRLEHPVGNAVVGDPFYYQWTPVDKAAGYELQLSTSTDFASPLDRCYTVHTTFVPNGTDDCTPGAAGTYYWRVIALDRHNSSSLSSRTEESEPVPAEVQRFSYLPEGVDLDAATPADGATVQVPTLSWEPVHGAAEYRVWITPIDGGSNGVNGVTTTGTSFTPRKALTVGKSYRWWVQTVSQDGRLGATLVNEAQSVFTVAAQAPASAALPEQLTPGNNAEHSRFPTLTWQPVAGASYYKIGVRPAESVQAYNVLTDKFAYPAGEDTGTGWLDPETLEWTVLAFDADDVELGRSSSDRLLRIVTLPDAVHPRAALTGAATAQDDTSCTALLPARCEDLRQTPALRWDPVPNAGGYRLYVSRDAAMTNLLFDPKYVDTNMWMSPTALIDSQAGDAFYWQVQPCTTEGVCGRLDEARWAFNKKSNPVELVSPARGATVDNDVTFTWTDYLETNSHDDHTGFDHVDATGVKARISAMHYVVEISTVPNFQTTIDTARVDQTTYTAFTETYPEGTLYWRVAAYDGSNNRLTNSETRTFVKSSPTPRLTSPTGNTTVSQTEPFTWEPLDFAASYDIEVYKNGDTVGQTSNRVFTGTSKQVAFTATSPLPASDLPYTWRIRRNDADGRDGAWTELSDPRASFRVAGKAPTLLAPSRGDVVAADGALFTWQQPEEATASYRFERRAVGSTSNAELVTTVGLAWAPTKQLPEGSWEWRVSTLDANGKIIKSSEWRGFTVDSTRPTVTVRKPTGKVGRATTFTVRFSERVVNVTTSTARVYLKGSPNPVSAKVKLNTTGRTATIDPVRNLKPGKVYTVRLTPGITDTAANPLVGSSWKVTVRR
ncbi:MAG TPA: Ig-like domain-containing protein [Marmoricola sp.]|nr:Ig-like domain-containing protein [Marmoricola sp.]